MRRLSAVFVAGVGMGWGLLALGFLAAGDRLTLSPEGAPQAESGGRYQRSKTLTTGCGL